jgi:hypothetical protein
MGDRKLSREDVVRFVAEHRAERAEADAAKERGEAIAYSMEELAATLQRERQEWGVEAKRREGIFALLDRIDMVAEDLASLDVDPDPSGHGIRRSIYKLALENVDMLVGRNGLISMVPGAYEVLQDYIVEKVLGESRGRYEDGLDA